VLVKQAVISYGMFVENVKSQKEKLNAFGCTCFTLIIKVGASASCFSDTLQFE
jgi:hypothetical protein